MRDQPDNRDKSFWHDALENIPVSSFRKSIAAGPGESVGVQIISSSTDSAERAALIEIWPRGEDGQRIPLNGWPRTTELLGDYFYLKHSDDGFAVTSEFFDVPDGCVSIELVGRQWKRKTFDYIAAARTLGPDDDVLPLALPNGQTIPVISGDFRVDVPLSATTEQINLTFDYRTVSDGTTQIAVQFYDDMGEQLLPFGDLSTDPEFGPYISLPFSPMEASVEVTAQVPGRATRLTMRGIRDKRVAQSSIETFDFTTTPTPEAAVDDFLSTMGPSDPLLVIDTTARPIGHSTLALRPNNLSLVYSSMGIHTIFFPFGSLKGFSSNVNDNLLQRPRHDFSAIVNYLAARRHGSNNVYVCSSFPDVEAISAADLFHASGWTVCYEARDDMEEFNRVGYSKWYAPMLERAMIERSDVVVAVSPQLASKLKGLVREKREIHVSPNAVKADTVSRSAALRSTEAWKSREESETIGYVGHLTSAWFDWDAVLDAARQLPEFRFELVGPGAPSDLILPDNVILRGSLAHEELEGVVNRWKVGIIPFQDSALTRSVDPNKIYEYFAWGLRCVTTEMGQVDSYPATWVYTDPKDFVPALEAAMSEAITDDEMRLVEDFVQGATWNARALQMLELLGLENYS